MCPSLDLFMHNALQRNQLKKKRNIFRVLTAMFKAFSGNTIYIAINLSTTAISSQCSDYNLHSSLECSDCYKADRWKSYMYHEIMLERRQTSNILLAFILSPYRRVLHLFKGRLRRFFLTFLGLGDEMSNFGKKVKSACEPNGSSGRSLSPVNQHL